MKHIALLCGSSNTVINFRLTLIRFLKKKDYKVSVVCLDDTRREEILKEEVSFYTVGVPNRTTNIFKRFFLSNRYKKLLCKLKPDLCFSFMLTPNTSGIIGAKKAKIQNLFSMVEGLGDAFSNNSLKWRLIRRLECFLYRKAFKNVRKVFFLNNDDKGELIKRKIIKQSQAIVVSGIGVDLDYFKELPIINHRSFLMIARLVETKGIFDYCNASRIVKKKYPNSHFVLLGEEFTLTAKDIQEYIDDGCIEYRGFVFDVRPYISQCGVFVLPSFYREGFPASIMEAMASGRCVITTDNVGCREAVVDGYTGFIVRPKDSSDLAKKCLFLCENPEIVDKMGTNAREFAERFFDEKNINAMILSILEQTYDYS